MSASLVNSHVDALEAKLREFESRFGSAQDSLSRLTGASPPPSEDEPHQTFSEGASSEPNIGLSSSRSQQVQVASPGPQQTLTTHYSSETYHLQTACETREPGAHAQSYRWEDKFSSLPVVEEQGQHVQRQMPQPQAQQQQQPLQSQQQNRQNAYGNSAAPATSQSSLPAEADESDEGENEDDTQVIDGMVEYTEPSPEVTEVDGTFGDSSTFNFALKVKASTMVNMRKPGTRHDSQASAGNKSTNEANNHLHSDFSASPSNGNAMVEHRNENDDIAALKSYLNSSSLQYLPQRHIAKSLLERYFLAVHPIWPFLLEDETRTLFEHTWSSDDAPSPIWLSQLNLIFALACQFYEGDDGAPLADVYEAGKQFYQRGQGFIIANAFNRCSIVMLQSLLLMAQYQQGTMRSNQCWLTTGHATRMALGLGLQSDLPSNTSLPPHEQELRRRLWWGCFSLDR